MHGCTQTKPLAALAHTNACDEAITTPTDESVRRAVAIQMISSKEIGLDLIENPLQGSLAVDTLIDIIEEGVCKTFEAISERGGVLGAMYQRGKIQEAPCTTSTRTTTARCPWWA